jgi:Flp pilus assembly protein TadD
MLAFPPRERRMTSLLRAISKTAAALAACAALLLAGGCTTLAPTAPVPVALFDDGAFAPVAGVPTRDDIFAVSDGMRGFLQRWMAGRGKQRGPQAGLAAALHDRGQLQLEYESDYTRTAAQAFDDRAGNCLSLVLMTATFAKELGLEVRFRSAVNFDTWGRQGDLFVHSGHLNLTVGRRTSLDGSLYAPWVTIDFLPPEQIEGLRTVEVGEATVVAMFLNNRAAELLAAGNVDAAYWHARRSIESDPGFAPAVNTLGVVWLRHGRPALAEAAFRRTLALDADNPRALGNLATAVAAQGRADEAAALRVRLARAEPEPPYHWFQLGRAAADRGDWRAARDFFAREVRRADFNAEFHHWLAVAHWKLGDAESARRELTLARQTSATRSERDRYAGKLARLAELGAATP